MAGCLSQRSVVEDYRSLVRRTQVDRITCILHVHLFITSTTTAIAIVPIKTPAVGPVHTNERLALKFFFRLALSTTDKVRVRPFNVDARAIALFWLSTADFSRTAAHTQPQHQVQTEQREMFLLHNCFCAVFGNEPRDLPPQVHAAVRVEGDWVAAQREPVQRLHVRDLLHRAQLLALLQQLFVTTKNSSCRAGAAAPATTRH